MTIETKMNAPLGANGDVRAAKAEMTRELFWGVRGAEGD
jgi:hypothetical protein